ncbi:hypothetical protein NJB14194_46230, partial [Mycobacterium montefiorense]
AGMTARLGALRNDQIDSGRGVSSRVRGGAGQRRHQHVVAVRAFDEVGRRRPERAGDQPDVMGKGDFEQRLIPLGRDVEAAGGCTRRFGRRADAVPGEQVFDERAVLLRKQVPDLFRVDAALLGADVFGRQQQVDPVGLAAGLLLDPGQLAAQPLRAVRDRPEDAESARVGDRGDDIATVAEGAYRELHTEQLGDSGPHVTTL